jgi:hypothetical protein
LRQRRFLLAAMAIICLSTTLVFAGEHRGVTRQEIEAKIRGELKAGASAADIELFFKRHHICCMWDKYTGMYVAIIRDVEPFHSITIDVYVDQQRRFVSAKVADSYTMP